jgi:hypothetical protein
MLENMTTGEKALIGATAIGIAALVFHKPTRNAVGLSDGKRNSPSSIYKRIIKSKNTGREKIINDTLHYGMGGVYVYTKEAEKAGIKGKKGKNSAFVHLNNEETKKMLDWLYKNDGYLYKS